MFPVFFQQHIDEIISVEIFLVKVLQLISGHQFFTLFLQIHEGHLLDESGFTKKESYCPKSGS